MKISITTLSIVVQEKELLRLGLELGSLENRKRVRLQAPDGHSKRPSRLSYSLPPYTNMLGELMTAPEGQNLMGYEGESTPIGELLLLKIKRHIQKISQGSL